MPDAIAQPEVLARLGASAARRVVAATVIGTLAVVFLWIGLFEPVAAPWRVVFLASGGFIALCCRKLWQATRGALILTREGLFAEDGAEVAAVERIASVDRGAFAFKPSNGFVLRLVAPIGTAWAPGLWWRVGRRVGVGGVTASGEARAMADIIAAMLAGGDRTR